MDIKIKINGKEYPCRPTMGALMRYKRETGEEVSEMKDGDIYNLCIYLWACVASASAHDGIPFDMDPMTFADSIEPEQMNSWTTMLAADAKGGKKTAEKKR